MTDFLTWHVPFDDWHVPPEIDLPRQMPAENHATGTLPAEISQMAAVILNWQNSSARARHTTTTTAHRSVQRPAATYAAADPNATLASISSLACLTNGFKLSLYNPQKYQHTTHPLPLTTTPYLITNKASGHTDCYSDLISAPALGLLFLFFFAFPTCLSDASDCGPALVALAGVVASVVALR